MNPTVFITTSLGSSLTLVLIFFNYIRKFNTDNFQRKLLLAMLCAAFLAIITNFINRFMAGYPGAGVFYLLNITNSIYLFTQNCTYYLGVVFIDYFAYKSTERSRKIIIAMMLLLAVYFISVVINIPLGYYFTISGDNRNVPGNLYFLRLLISYMSVLLIVVDVFLSSKYFRHSQAYLIILFILIIGVGAGFDLTLHESSLVWPCFAASVLYIYFFILQSDSMIDSLTQIGNRSSFNEFIDKLSRQNTKTSYSIAMIDMDRFKEINDTLGHLVGDNALRDVATIIKDCIRSSDFAARYGGDEFVVAVGAEYDIERVINRILETIGQQNSKRSHPYQLYISYGYDVYTTKSGESIYAFLAKIDAMMYKQKEERKKTGIPSSITSELPG